MTEFEITKILERFDAHAEKSDKRHEETMSNIIAMKSDIKYLTEQIKGTSDFTGIKGKQKGLEIEFAAMNTKVNRLYLIYLASFDKTWLFIKTYPKITLLIILTIAEFFHIGIITALIPLAHTLMVKCGWIIN